MIGWTMELLEDSSIKDALSLVDPTLAQDARSELEALAHQTLIGPQSAFSEAGTPFVTIAGSRMKREGEMICDPTMVSVGDPLILTQADVNRAAETARDVWLDGAKKYRHSIAERAGTGAHIVLVWRTPPEFILWSDTHMRICLAMRARLAFETIEDGAERPGCASSSGPQSCCPQPVDFFAINKAFA